MSELRARYVSSSHSEKVSTYSLCEQLYSGPVACIDQLIVIVCDRVTHVLSLLAYYMTMIAYNRHVVYPGSLVLSVIFFAPLIHLCRRARYHLFSFVLYS